MATRLYHKDVHAPAVLFRSPGFVRLRYSTHAQCAARDDRYGDLRRHLTALKDFDLGEIIEVELDQSAQICKRVVRFQITETLSLVMAVSGDGLVKTVWGNQVEDVHATLDRRKYVQPPKPVVAPAAVLA